MVTDAENKSYLLLSLILKMNQSISTIKSCLFEVVVSMEFGQVSYEDTYISKCSGGPSVQDQISESLRIMQDCIRSVPESVAREISALVRSITEITSILDVGPDSGLPYGEIYMLLREGFTEHEARITAAITAYVG